MPATQASNKIPYCGADTATEELPEPSQDALRLAELEAENQILMRLHPSPAMSGRGIGPWSNSTDR